MVAKARGFILHTCYFFSKACGRLALSEQFPRGVVHRHFLALSSYRLTGKFKKKSSNLIGGHNFILVSSPSYTNWSAHTNRATMKKQKITKKLCARVIAFLAIWEIIPVDEHLREFKDSFLRGFGEANLHAKSCLCILGVKLFRNIFEVLHFLWSFCPILIPRGRPLLKLCPRHNLFFFLRKTSRILVKTAHKLGIQGCGSFKWALVQSNVPELPTKNKRTKEKPNLGDVNQQKRLLDLSFKAYSLVA